MTRASLFATATFGLLAIAGMAAIAALPARIGPVSPPSADGQRFWSETQMAGRDHEKVVSAIALICDGPASTAHTQTTFQTAALAYSEELKDQRIKIAKQIEHDHAVTWLYQLGIICFGAAATILIGLRPLFEKLNRDNINTTLAATAIIFSGLVTCLSSMNAIAAGQTDLLHNQRTLAQLQQLHWRIDNDVFAATKLCDPNSSDLAKVESWKDRFEKIADEAMPTIAQPGDLRQAAGAPGPEKPVQQVGNHV